MHPAQSIRKRESSPPSPSEASMVPARRCKRRRQDDGHLEMSSVSSAERTSNSHRLQNAPSAREDPKRSPPSSGILSHAKNMVINNSVLQNVQTMGSSSFMKDFVTYTLPGAAYDSSARDPPPRCHPGTRLTSMRRALDFLDAREGTKRLLWIVGPAGVGKSAIMQSIAESISGAKVSIFFSVNVRDDPSRVFPTIAFQLAAKHTQYCSHIQKDIARDPTIPETSLEAQFNHFIIEPFADNIFDQPHSVPILIDGLDECRDASSQCRLLALIIGLVSEHPSAPFKWIIASRPEPHITNFFNQREHTDLYEKEEITVNSSEACKDVERHLRAEFGRIRQKHPALMLLRQWPDEKGFLLIAAAAKGLFGYSSTAMKFIDDPICCDPESQLLELLSVINCVERREEGETNPMAQLHTLYDHILDRVPTKYLPTTRKFLAQLWDGSEPRGFAGTCDWLGVPHTKAYASLHSLHSVLDIPPPETGKEIKVKPYHKSFMDYLGKRFIHIEYEHSDHFFPCSIRILKQVSDERGGNVGDARDRIKLSWPRQDERSVMMAQREVHQYATRRFLADVRKTRQFVADDQMFVRYFKVMATSMAYAARFAAWPWRPKSEEYDEMSWPIWRDNHFFIPIKEVTPKYHEHTRKLKLRFCSKNPIISGDYRDSECNDSSHKGLEIFDKEFYTITWTVSNDGALCICVRDFHRILDLVRMESPEHQVMLVTGVNGSAVVMGRVAHPRDEEVEIQFSWLNESPFCNPPNGSNLQM